MIDKNFNEIKIPRLLKMFEIHVNMIDVPPFLFWLYFSPLFSFSVMHLKVKVIK